MLGITLIEKGGKYNLITPEKRMEGHVVKLEEFKETYPELASAMSDLQTKPFVSSSIVSIKLREELPYYDNDPIKFNILRKSDLANNTFEQISSRKSDEGHKEFRYRKIGSDEYIWINSDDWVMNTISDTGKTEWEERYNDSFLEPNGIDETFINLTSGSNNYIFKDIIANADTIQVSEVDEGIKYTVSRNSETGFLMGLPYYGGMHMNVIPSGTYKKSYVYRFDDSVLNRF